MKEDSSKPDNSEGRRIGEWVNLMGTDLQMKVIILIPVPEKIAIHRVAYDFFLRLSIKTIRFHIVDPVKLEMPSTLSSREGKLRIENILMELSSRM